MMNEYIHDRSYEYSSERSFNYCPRDASGGTLLLFSKKLLQLMLTVALGTIFYSLRFNSFINMKSTPVTVLLVLLRVSIWEIEATVTNEIKHDAVFKVHSNFAKYQAVKNLIASEKEVESTKQMDFINPCVCQNYQCSCCAGIRVIGFGFDRRVCADLTFDPKNSKLDFRFLLNNNTVFSNRLSTHNRQVCVPVIPITLAGPFDLCARLYDMRIVEQRLHACLSMMARVSQYPIAVLQFNCMEMGPGGVGLVRPVGGNYSESAPLPSSTDRPQLDSDVFDVVTEATEANTSTEGYYLEFPSRS